MSDFYTFIVYPQKEHQFAGSIPVLFVVLEPSGISSFVIISQLDRISSVI